MAQKRIQLLAVLIPAFCLSGVSAAAQAAKKTGDQVECKDGTLSKKGRGACSGHGGVATHVSTAVCRANRVTAHGTEAEVP